MPSPRGGISIIIPAYNEENAIGLTLDAVQKALSSMDRPMEILVVDDGSSDATAERAARSGVRVLRHPINSGYGRSLMTGIASAQHDTVAILDADGTYPVHQLPDLIHFYDQGFDMAVGARQGRHYHSSLGKSVLRALFRFLAEFTCGRTIPDINSGFRVFDRRPVLAHRSAISTGFSFTTTVTLLFMLEHYFVGYLPIDYQSRVGQSKVRLWRDSLRSLQIIVMAIAQFNPFKLYLLILAGAAIGTTGLLVVAQRYPLMGLSLMMGWNTLCILMGLAVLAVAATKPASSRTPGGKNP